jgi:hypothetical protein
MERVTTPLSTRWFNLQIPQDFQEYMRDLARYFRDKPCRPWIWDVNGLLLLRGSGDLFKEQI